MGVFRAENERGFDSSQQERRETSPIKQVLAITLPSVEVANIYKPKDRTTAAPSDPKSHVDLLAEVARIKADTQNDLGIKLGVYPEGQVVVRKRIGATLKTYTYGPVADVGADLQPRGYRPSVLKDFTAQIPRLFPGNKKKEFQRLLNDIELQNRSPLADKLRATGERIDIAYANILRNFFRGSLSENSGRPSPITAECTKMAGEAPSFPVDALRVVPRLGVPVVICKYLQTLHEFKPYIDLDLPANTHALSFEITRHCRPMARRLQEETLLVVAHESATLAEIDQLIRTQAIFKIVQLAHNQKAYPILTTPLKSGVLDFAAKRIGSPAQFTNPQVDLAAKEYALSAMIGETQENQWHRESAREQIVYSFGRDIFRQESDAYLGNLLTSAQIAFSARAKEEVRAGATHSLRTALDLLRQLSTLRPSREFQLIATNYLSLFSWDKWPEAIKAFESWPEHEKFIQSLRIPRLEKNTL